eukprot:g6397.t1
MDPLRDRATAAHGAADEKPRRRGSGGGSKKSSRRKPSSSSSIAAGPGGERPPGHGTDARRGSSGSGGGVAARADLVAHRGPDGDAAQRKDYLRPGEPASTSRTRSGAKVARREGGRSHVGGGEDRTNLERAQQERIQRRPAAEPVPAVDGGGPVGGGGGAGSGVDRAILQKWRSDASATVAVGGGRSIEQEVPAEVEAEDNGGGYDDEDFEDYSDEFEGEEEGPPTPVSAAAAAPVARPGSSRGRGGGGGAGAVVSPSLKMRTGGDVRAPDDKALEELRDSLREENTVARERQVARPSANGRRFAAPRAAAGGSAGGSATAAVAKGTFSVHSSADAKPSRRSSGFKMADAKALTRALAKGDPRTARVLAIRAASRLEVESVRLFDQAPISPIDLYHRRLRAQPAFIRQAGSQTNEDARSVEVQTDEIVCADKEVQFHLGHDDTALENLMRRLRSNRRPATRLDHPAGVGGAEEKNEQDWTVVVEGDEHASGAARGSTTTFKGLYNGDEDGSRGVDGGGNLDAHLRRQHAADTGDGGGGSDSQYPPPAPLRLGKFLRQASVVMETLCEENVLHAAVRAGATPVSSASGGDRGGGDHGGRFMLFSKFPEKGEEGWEEVAYGHGRMGPEQAAAAAKGSVGGVGGLGELLEGSGVVGVQFSRVKRSMLVTAHARPVGRRSRRLWRGSENGADDGKDDRGDSGGDGGSEEMGERGAALEGSGIVCVWNTDNVKAGPVSVLCGEGIFSCLCLPLHQAHVVIAGTAEGCLLLWDLRGPASTHLAAEARDLGLPCGIHQPTYTTAGGAVAGTGGGGLGGALDTGCAHTSTIVSVVPIPVGEGGGVDSGGGGGGGLGGVLSLEEANFFQVASLDDRGTVSIWLASETPRGDDGGSQVRKQQATKNSSRPSFSIPVLPPLHGPASTISSSTTMGELDSGAPTAAAAAAAADAAASARALAFPPGDPNRLLVGVSSGRVTHASRLGNPPPPREYRPRRKRDEPLFAAPGGGGGGEGQEREGWEATGGVACLAFSPFFQEYFLAGCGDGSVRLYKEDSAVPLTAWEGGFSAAGGSRSAASAWPEAVTAVAWSEHRPAVFFVLDAAGALHAFDVLEDDTGPVSSVSCPPTAAAAAAAKGRSVPEEGLPAAAPPVFALSSETLATGSRPRAALALGGRVFTSNLADRVFRQQRPRPLLPGEGGRGAGGRVDGSISERERMAEWLGGVLWG